MTRFNAQDTPSPSAASSHPATTAWAGLISLAAAMGIGRFVYTPILPAMAEALHLTEAQAGWIASANFAGYLGGAMLAAGALPGKPRAWMMAGLVASALSTAAMDLSSSPLILALIRAAGGVASALVLVYGSTIVLDRLILAGRADLFGWHFAGVGAGIAVSAVLVSVLARAGADWRELWLASGAAAALGAVVVAMLLPPVPDRRVPASQEAPSTWPSRGLAPLLWAYGLFGFGYVITATFLVVIVRSSPQSRAVEPIVWLVVGLTAAPSATAWIFVGRKFGWLAAFAVASLVEALGVIVSVLLPTVAGALIAAALLGATFMGLTALGLTAARERSATPRANLAWMTAAFGLGQIIGPAFAGYVSHKTGSFVVASLSAAAALLVAALLTAASRRT